jgi:hemoglobin
MPPQRKKLDETLLKRLGGVTVLAAAIDEFYFRLLADDSLTIFFQNVDLTWLKNHQKNFLMSALSGPVDVESAIKHIRRAHSRLFDKGLNEKHFDKVATHLVQTLRDMGVEQQLVNEVAAVVIPLRPAFIPASSTKKTGGAPEQSPTATAPKIQQPEPQPEKKKSLCGCLGALLGR